MKILTEKPKSKAVATVLLAVGAAVAMFAIACGGTETVIQTVVVEKSVPGETVIQTVMVEKEVQIAGETVVQTVVVEKEVQVVVTATPVETDAMMEPELIDLPNSKSEPGHVIFADVGSALGSISGNGGSLPDAPLAGGRNWGAGESLFTPGDADWDIPMLAESWDLANDLSTVTIKIQEGVRFHGEWGESKAEDIAWVINRTNPALNPESIAASAANFTALFGDVPVEATDDYTIRATFNNFDVRWASNLLNQEASGGLTSIATAKRAFDENGREWLKDNFVGTGPYEVTDFKSSTSVTVTKVGYDHWRKNGNVDVLKILAVPEEFTRVALLQNGEADVAFIDPKDLARIAKSGFTQVGAGQGIQEGVMFTGNL